MPRTLRAAVVETHAHRAGFHVGTPMTNIVWTRNCSALAIFALNGVVGKSRRQKLIQLGCRHRRVEVVETTGSVYLLRRV